MTTSKTRDRESAPVPEAPPPPVNGDGWEKIQTDRPYYNVEKCRATPVQGYLLSLDEMPPTDNGSWAAFVVKLTAPCLVTPTGRADDADAEPITANIGDEILLPATVKLKQSLSRYLIPGSILEMRITPLEKVRIGGKRTMWTFSVQANTKSIRPRTALYALQAPKAKSAEDDIPF